MYQNARPTSSERIHQTESGIMHRTHFRIGSLALILSFGLLACGDDGPTQSGDELTQAEASAMMEALAMAGGTGFIGVGFPGAGGGMALQQVPLDFTQNCTGGGTVVYSGSMSVSGESSFTLNSTLTHNSCTETASSDGSSWTFNGDPSITMSLTGTATESSINFQGSQGGGISWSNGGRSGSCDVDVQYSISGNPQGNVTVSISGTSCGYDVSGSFSGSA